MIGAACNSLIPQENAEVKSFSLGFFLHSFEWRFSHG